MWRDSILKSSPKWCHVRSPILSFHVTHSMPDLMLCTASCVKFIVKPIWAFVLALLYRVKSYAVIKSINFTGRWTLKNLILANALLKSLDTFATDINWALKLSMLVYFTQRFGTYMNWHWFSLSTLLPSAQSYLHTKNLLSLSNSSFKPLCLVLDLETVLINSLTI